MCYDGAARTYPTDTPPNRRRWSRRLRQTTKPWTINSPHTQSVSAQYSYEHDNHPQHGSGRRSPPAPLARCPHCTLGASPAAPRHLCAYLRSLLCSPPRLHPCNLKATLVQHMQVCLCDGYPDLNESQYILQHVFKCTPQNIKFQCIWCTENVPETSQFRRSFGWGLKSITRYSLSDLICFPIW
jgi:hypothetical protein